MTLQLTALLWQFFAWNHDEAIWCLNEFDCFWFAVNLFCAIKLDHCFFDSTVARGTPSCNHPQCRVQRQGFAQAGQQKWTCNNKHNAMLS